MNASPVVSRRERVGALSEGCVHVWRASTARANLRPFTEILSAEELGRAERFFFERDRRAFVVCRGTLRKLVSLYTGEDARKVQFCVSAFGKPGMQNTKVPDLRFNVSHSGQIALLAFSLNQEIGVDVEFKRADVDFAGLAATSFAPDECAAIAGCDPAERASLFYEIWTRKEASIKADGRGLSVPLEQFSVNGNRIAFQWREISTAASHVLPGGMWSRVVDVPADYAAAIARSVAVRQVFQWTVGFENRGVVRPHSHPSELARAEYAVPGAERA
ncbi:MAG: 4'-phosphopantetheinyl transferase superfamily protein [Candidatus Acidiferrales bacterium]